MVSQPVVGCDQSMQMSFGPSSSLQELMVFSDLGIFHLYSIVVSRILWSYPAAEVADDRCFPLREVAVLNMLACVAHQTQIECQIVYAGNLHGEQLLSLK